MLRGQKNLFSFNLEIFGDQSSCAPFIALALLTPKSKLTIKNVNCNPTRLGFIKILFPTAKIIHCRRNLKDTALSIYKNMYEGWAFPWSYNQKFLIKFINLYKELMTFWRSKIPNFTNSENLAENGPGFIISLVNFSSKNHL